MDNHIKEQIGALLLSLHNYKEGKTTLDEVEFNLQYLATKAGVETFGEIGETVQYQPFEHYLIDARDGEVTDVVVHALGVRARRDDGSYKVLSKALVN